MPSVIVGAQSGGVVLISGNPFSGRLWPIAGVLLKPSRDNTAAVYATFSGVATITSGGGLSSGGGADGMELSPGDAYMVPKAFCSGDVQKIRLTVAAASSGQRVFWEGL